MTTHNLAKEILIEAFPLVYNEVRTDYAEMLIQNTETFSLAELLCFCTSDHQSYLDQALINLDSNPLHQKSVITLLIQCVIDACQEVASAHQELMQSDSVFYDYAGIQNEVLMQHLFKLDGFVGQLTKKLENN